MTSQSEGQPHTRGEDHLRLMRPWEALQEDLPVGFRFLPGQARRPPKQQQIDPQGVLMIVGEMSQGVARGREEVEVVQLASGVNRPSCSRSPTYLKMSGWTRTIARKS